MKDTTRKALSEVVRTSSHRTLPENQHKLQEAIFLFATGHSQKQVCQKLDVSRNTVAKWLRRDTFKRAVEEAQSEIWESNSQRAVGLIHKTMDALVEALDSDDPKYKYTVASKIFQSLANKGIENVVTKEGQEEAWSDDRLESEFEYIKKKLSEETE